MSSILKVDTIQDQSGNNIINESGNVITIGASGDTITVPAGATVSGFTSAGIDDNADATAITIDSSERIGIGTTSPTSTFRTSIKGDYSSIIGGIEFDSGGGDKFTVGHASATSPSGTLNVVGSGNLILKTTNTERFRIKSDGTVGIGTSTPNAELHISKSGNGNTTELILENTFTASGSTDETTQLQSRFGGYDASYIITGKEEDFTTSANRSSFMSFTTRKDGTLSEKLRITSGGLVGIGTGSGVDKELHVQASDGSAEIRIENSAHTVRLDLSALQDTTGLNTIGSHPIFFKIASSEKMRLTSTGLGIGTSSPQTIFHILQTAETVDSGIKIVGSSSPVSGRIYMNSTDIHIDNATAGQNTGITLDTAGQTGIGTASPSTTLDVNGTIKATGFDGANAPAWSAKLSSAQSCANNASVLIICDTEELDTDSAYNTSTGIFTVPSGKGGKYMVGAVYRTNGSQASTRIATSLFVGSNVIRQTNFNQVASGEATGACHAVLNLSAGNEVSFKIFQNSGSTINAEASGKTYFYGYKIG